MTTIYVKWLGSVLGYSIGTGEVFHSEMAAMGAARKLAAKTGAKIVNACPRG